MTEVPSRLKAFSHVIPVEAGIQCGLRHGLRVLRNLSGFPLSRERRVQQLCMPHGFARPLVGASGHIRADLTMLTIRQEQPSDAASISRVHEEAFSHRAEADLVERLRMGGKFKISLIAEIDGQIVGHILFTAVSMEGSGSTLRILGLAPMAVLPEFQRRGVGSELIRRGLALCVVAHVSAVVVVGHPEYYPRFGFVPASRYGLRCEYDVPDDVFMALELRAGALGETSGLVRYQPEFADSDGIADG